MSLDFILCYIIIMSCRCGLSWGSGRGLLEIYQGWTDAASAGDPGGGLLEVCLWWTDSASAWDLEEVY